MEIHVLTTFPEMFVSPLEASIVKRARARGLLGVHVHQLRDYTTDRHRVTDDAPYGGGAGMIMKPGPIVAALQAVQQRFGSAYRILLSPQGRLLTQEIVKALAQHERLLLVCGHYGGVDARVQAYVDEELSIGDYVLTGGELPAMVVIDAVSRMLPDVLGHWQSAEDDSLYHGLLQGPQYTRPAVFNGVGVPAILLSGNHAAIVRWRRRQALYTTWQRRPDLLERASLSSADRLAVQEWQQAGDASHDA
jgi:tRNA (guanine37-N1)-methyltransferase